VRGVGALFIALLTKVIIIVFIAPLTKVTIIVSE
jgi:hypothetical protein